MSVSKLVNFAQLNLFLGVSQSCLNFRDVYVQQNRETNDVDVSKSKEERQNAEVGGGSPP